MKNTKVRLITIQDVHTFAGLVGRHNIDVDLSSGRYIVDAKSIMGIYSLDLLHPIQLSAHTDDDAEFAALLADIKDFIVEE